MQTGSLVSVIIPCYLDALLQEPDLDLDFGYVQQFLSPDVIRDRSQDTIVHEDSMAGYIPSALMVRRVSFFRWDYLQLAGKWESSSIGMHERKNWV